VVLGLVLTKDGIPLCHRVFPGETPDKGTLQQVVRDLKACFPLHRCIVVSHRGDIAPQAKKTRQRKLIKATS